jgi:ubiquinone/menaquinone biosynthesis C-methylase UbiE
MPDVFALKQPQRAATHSSDERGTTDEERAYYRLSSRVYSVFAYGYDAVTFPFMKLRRDVVQAARLEPGSKVLDVATGTGAQALAFAQAGCDVTGVDLSEAMLRRARQKPALSTVKFQFADAAALPFDEASFDATCVSFALHEMPRSIRERVMSEMARVTRRGGAVIVVEYGLPRNRVVGAIVYRIEKLYEVSDYVDFMHGDLAAELGQTGVVVHEQRPSLGGLAQITIGKKP